MIWFRDSSSAAVRISQPFDFCVLGDHIVLTGANPLAPTLFRLIAKGPYSSMEKKASSSFRPERICLITSTFAWYSGSLLVSTILAFRHFESSRLDKGTDTLFSMCVAPLSAIILVW